MTCEKSFISLDGDCKGCCVKNNDHEGKHRILWAIDVPGEMLAMEWEKDGDAAEFFLVRQ